MIIGILPRDLPTMLSQFIHELAAHEMAFMPSTDRFDYFLQKHNRPYSERSHNVGHVRLAQSLPEHQCVNGAFICLLQTTKPNNFA